MSVKRIEILASDHALIKQWAKNKGEPIWLLVARMTTACMETDIACPDEEDNDEPQKAD